MLDPPGRKRLIRVLEEDPDLGEALTPPRFEQATALALAPLVTLRAGDWPPVRRPARPIVGILLVEGLVGNRIVIPERSHLELLGPGDVLRPWVGLGPDASTAASLNWWIFEEARACMLDWRFCMAIRDLPEIYDALAERLVLRARRLNFQLAVNAVVGIDERILVTLWHFADRWGRVTPDGVALRFPLTHRDIADLIGASRPSVSTGLMRLRSSCAIEHRDGGWLLYGRAPERLRELQEQAALARAEAA